MQTAKHYILSLIGAATGLSVLVGAETATSQSTLPVPRQKPVSSTERSIVPQAKPGNPQSEAAEKSAEAKVSKQVEASVPCKGIDGKFVEVPPVVGENGCGFATAVRLEAAGQGAPIRLPANPVLRCHFAGQLTNWIAVDVAAAASEIAGEALKLIRTGPGYQCRRRNNKPDGKLSEHAVGDAIDIAAFEFESGKIISIEDGWGARDDEDPSVQARFLRAIHAAACERFTTVLGPEADEYHQSHFHLDSGCHGKTCTYQICQ